MTGRKPKQGKPLANTYKTAVRMSAALIIKHEDSLITSLDIVMACAATYGLRLPQSSFDRVREDIEAAKKKQRVETLLRKMVNGEDVSDDKNPIFE